MMLGADEGILMGNRSALISELKVRTKGRGADVVIEAIGHPDAWELATHLVRKGGSINFFGGCPAGTKVPLDTALLHYSEVTCRASFHHTPEHIRRSLEIIADGHVDASHLVNHEEPLSALPASAGRPGSSPKRPHQDCYHPVAGPRNFACRTTAAEGVHPQRSRLRRRLLARRCASLYALARHSSLREFSRRQLSAAEGASPGFLQRLCVLPLGR